MLAEIGGGPCWPKGGTGNGGDTIGTQDVLGRNGSNFGGAVQQERLGSLGGETKLEGSGLHTGGNNKQGAKKHWFFQERVTGNKGSPQKVPPKKMGGSH